MIHELAINQVRLATQQQDALAESRQLLKKAADVVHQFRPFNPEEENPCPLWERYCETGDELRRAPTPAAARAMLEAAAALAAAAKNAQTLRDVLRPMAESHQRRLAEIAGEVIDKAGEILIAEHAKRAASQSKATGMFAAAEAAALDAELAGAQTALAAEKAQIKASPADADGWLAEHGF